MRMIKSVEVLKLFNRVIHFVWAKTFQYQRLPSFWKLDLALLDSLIRKLQAAKTKNNGL